MLRRTLLAALLALLVVPSAAHATRIFAITAESSPRLLSFGSSSPSVIVSSVPVTGLAAGEVVAGMDMRPKDGGLYALTTQGSVARVRRVDPVSGALAAGVTLTADPADLSAPFTTLTVGSGAGVDFNPVPDRLRITTVGNQSIRVNPDTGVAFTDGDLNPGDPSVVGSAYLNAWPGALTTTLYDVDYATDQLLIQNPPNNGTLVPVGVGLGIDLDTPGTVGFDIAAEDNTGFLAASVGGTVNLYSVDLTTGAATAVGAIGTGTTQLTGITAAENLIGFSGASFSAREDGGVLELTVVRSVPRGTTTVAFRDERQIGSHRQRLHRDLRDAHVPRRPDRRHDRRAAEGRHCPGGRRDLRRRPLDAHAVPHHDGLAADRHCHRHHRRRRPRP